MTPLSFLLFFASRQEQRKKRKRRQAAALQKEPSMNQPWVILIIPLIAFAVWLLSSLIKEAEEPVKDPRRRPGDPSRPRRPASELDRFLAQQRQQRSQTERPRDPISDAPVPAARPPAEPRPRERPVRPPRRDGPRAHGKPRRSPGPRHAGSSSISPRLRLPRPGPWSWSWSASRSPTDPLPGPRLPRRLRPRLHQRRRLSRRCERPTWPRPLPRMNRCLRWESCSVRRSPPGWRSSCARSSMLRSASGNARILDTRPLP